LRAHLNEETSCPNSKGRHLAFNLGEYFQLLPHEMEKILKEVLKAVKSWKKIAKNIGISRAEQEIMSSALQYKIE
jgi:serine/threonine-protein kinase HipA